MVRHDGKVVHSSTWQCRCSGQRHLRILRPSILQKRLYSSSMHVENIKSLLSLLCQWVVNDYYRSEVDVTPLSRLQVLTNRIFPGSNLTMAVRGKIPFWLIFSCGWCNWTATTTLIAALNRSRKQRTLPGRIKKGLTHSHDWIATSQSCWLSKQFLRNGYRSGLSCVVGAQARFHLLYVLWINQYPCTCYTSSESIRITLFDGFIAPTAALNMCFSLNRLLTMP